MSKIDFDLQVNRKESNAVKWRKYAGKDVIPLWIADSEFRVAQPILDAMNQRIEHGVFGYHNPSQNEQANNAVRSWLLQQHGWKIEPEWLIWTPGVVPAFHVAIEAMTQPGDQIAVQSPNYPPILAAAKDRNRTAVFINTKLVNERWTLDFVQLEQVLSDPKTTLFLLCNPMNPCGTVLKQNELELIESLCLKHNVALCSDEIHADLILNQQCKHIPAGSLVNIGSKSITLMAASKTFNIAGLGVSFAIIPDRKVRTAYLKAAKGICPSANPIGVLATSVAFTECHGWYRQQLDYLRANQDYLFKELNALPGLQYYKSDATFLAWVDASGLEVDDVQSFFEEAGVGPSPGADFGWPQFARFNFACPRAMLEQAVSRLQQSLKS